MTTRTVTPLPALTAAAREHRATGDLQLDTGQRVPEVVELFDGVENRVPLGVLVEGDPENLHGAALTLLACLRILREQLLLAVANGSVQPDQVVVLDELADLETAHAASVSDDLQDTDATLRALQQVTEGRGILLGMARGRHLLAAADELGAAPPTGKRGRTESALTRAARALQLNPATATSIVGRYERRRAAWSAEGAA